MLVLYFIQWMKWMNSILRTPAAQWPVNSKMCKNPRIFLSSDINLVWFLEIKLIFLSSYLQKQKILTTKFLLTCDFLITKLVISEHCLWYRDFYFLCFFLQTSYCSYTSSNSRLLEICFLVAWIAQVSLFLFLCTGIKPGTGDTWTTEQSLSLLLQPSSLPANSAGKKHRERREGLFLLLSCFINISGQGKSHCGPWWMGLQSLKTCPVQMGSQEGTAAIPSWGLSHPLVLASMLLKQLQLAETSQRKLSWAAKTSLDFSPVVSILVNKKLYADVHNFKIYPSWPLFYLFPSA